jgi:hypothetical protein
MGGGGGAHLERRSGRSDGVNIIQYTVFARAELLLAAYGCASVLVFLKSWLMIS